MRKIRLNIFFKVSLLFVYVCGAAYLLMNGLYSYFLLSIPLIAFQLFTIYRNQLLLYKEVEQFTEALGYQDFSRNFSSNSASELRPLYTNFNKISQLFRQASREKETQFQYLQKILELVNTGILSYEIESGEVIWMNESLKQMLDLPFLKTIRSLSKRDETLYRSITSLKPGDSKTTELSAKNSHTRILLSVTAFQTNNKKYHLLAFQNINEALDENESQAWKKLLSVLTHEIMNSIAPISSLADTIKNRLGSLDKRLDAGNSLADLELGMSTIKRRSEGLLKFAETYRNLNKINKPILQIIFVRDLFENLQVLMQPTLEQKNIALEIIIKDQNLYFQADPTLIEQVMINLIVNAIEAVKNNSEPLITLSAEQIAGKTIIKVIDNGAGIEKEILDKIFIPFFSTRKTGSGIGLTLCKQIMMLHHGNIQVISQQGAGTKFILSFS